MAARGWIRTTSGTMLVLTALVAGATPASSQDDFDDDESRDYKIPPWSVDALAFGVSDSNLLQDPGPLPSYGFQGGVRVRVQSAITRPVLRLQWDWRVREYEATDRLNRRTHRVSAVLGKRFGFVELGGRTSLDLNETTEDQEIATVVRALPAVEFRYGPARLGLEGRYWQKRLPGPEQADEFIRGGEAEFALSGSVLRAGVAVRYEEADADDERRRYDRIRYTGETRVRLGSATLEWESSFRIRTFGERMVSVDGADVETRDERWTHSASLRYRLPQGTEFLLEFERQNRESNDLERHYTRDRFTLGMVLPLIDFVPDGGGR